MDRSAPRSWFLRLEEGVCNDIQAMSASQQAAGQDAGMFVVLDLGVIGDIEPIKT